MLFIQENEKDLYPPDYTHAGGGDKIKNNLKDRMNLVLLELIH